MTGGSGSATAAAVVAISIVVGACGGGAADTAGGVIVRDSAGIEIVESPAALADQRYERRLGDPVADIGVVDGAPEYQLFRVTSVASLADGRIVVVNGGTQELRFYDSAGRFLFSTGGRGDGPGEYQFPTLVPSHFSDSLFVFDLQASRISVLNTDGVLVRTVRPEGFAEPIGALRDGRLLVANNTARAGMDMRVDRELERITRDRFDAFVEERVAAADDPADAAEVRRQYGETPMRERMPAYSRLLVDDNGNVWAERYREDNALPATWTIFNASGEAAGMVTVPSGVRLHSVAGSRAVGVVRDGMDVEHVVAWPLIQRGEGA
jgi:hypothetical protein